ncbi:MAG TPA: AraC family transcriptional regulator [Firmicutes bacterium]|nr:AraC family transcriptional regulator [Bacillota bacterium]
MQITQVHTDDTLQEIRRHGTADFPFEYYLDDVRRYEKQAVEWHWHKEFEFVWVERGAVDCRVGSEGFRLTEGMGLFINSGVLHRFEAAGVGLMPNILFSPSFIAGPDTAVYRCCVAPMLSAECGCVLLDGSAPWHGEMIGRLWEIYRQAQTEGPVRELRVQTAVGSLWADFLEHASSRFAVRSTGGHVLLQSRLQRMLRFIHERYADKITLNEIAGAANISKSEALRCFHAGMQTTPVRCLIAYRLHCAKELLESTGRPVARIASDVGFEDAGYFARMFTREFGLPPRTFRARRPHDAADAPGAAWETAPFERKG